jgi:hypothetical protein
MGLSPATAAFLSVGFVQVICWTLGAILTGGVLYPTLQAARRHGWCKFVEASPRAFHESLLGLASSAVDLPAVATAAPSPYYLSSAAPSEDDDDDDDEERVMLNDVDGSTMLDAASVLDPPLDASNGEEPPPR